MMPLLGKSDQVKVSNVLTNEERKGDRLRSRTIDRSIASSQHIDVALFSSSYFHKTTARERRVKDTAFRSCFRSLLRPRRSESWRVI